jgi:hypothetical protein
MINNKGDDTGRNLIDTLEGFQSKTSIIKPVERHRLNGFRETAINYEIAMEMKYL